MDREIRTVLHVDGSASTLFYVGMLLKRLEYKVETARSAEDALRAMEERFPSIVLTEVVLPGMNGVDLLKRVKADQHRKNIPVVILTSEVDTARREECLRLGAAGYLCKPVEPDVLYRTLQSVSESIPRANIRLKTSLTVFIGDGTQLGGAMRSEQIIAISEGGVFVKTGYPQPQNALTPVRIILPRGEVEAKATVIYSYGENAGPYQQAGMGLKFTEISDSGRAAIRRFIREQLTSDIEPAVSDQSAGSGVKPPATGSNPPTSPFAKGGDKAALRTQPDQG